MDSLNGEATAAFNYYVEQVKTLRKKEKKLDLRFKTVVCLVFLAVVLLVVCSTQYKLFEGENLIYVLGSIALLGILWWKYFTSCEEIDKSKEYYFRMLNLTLHDLSRKKKTELCQEASILDYYTIPQVESPREGYHLLSSHHQKCGGKGRIYHYVRRQINGMTVYDSNPNYWCTECGGIEES